MAWNKGKWFASIALIAAFAAYLFVLQRNANERDLRTLQLNEAVTKADCVRISVTVTGVNPGTRQLTAQLMFRLAGKIARDEVTPSADLKLLVNSIGGQQEFDFPKGTRMLRIEVTFPLEGELNRYPLDRYETALRFLATTPGRPPKPPTPKVPEGSPSGASQSQPPAEAPPDTADETSQTGELAISDSDLQDHVPVPISLAVLASIPGIKFTGEASRGGDPQVTAINLKLRRPENLIVVSMLVMVGMMTLALSVFAMALKATASDKKVDYLPLSLAISLIFGLPALRNIQPYVPPVGALGDYFSFIWAEMFVATSAIVTIWTWLVRSDRV
jgi:hypothetical protein